jgi:biopolymer transport protein ExbD
MTKIHRMKASGEIPQASLADVAFLLLIFFIATATITEEFGLSLILPAKSTALSSMAVERRDVMVISTDPTGTVFLVDDQPTPLYQIRVLVKEAEAANDKLVISVEPPATAPYKVMVDILDELKMAGARRISLRTKGV